MVTTAHSTSSSYREMVLEHLLVGEMMRLSWQRHWAQIELLKSQVDASGYDIVLEVGSLMRHIQLNASHMGAATPQVSVNMELARKASGCVVWIFFEPDNLIFSHFLWFGGVPGSPIGDLSSFRTAVHTKRNAQGLKTERANIRVLPRAAFDRVPTVEALMYRLFGPPQQSVEHVLQLDTGLGEPD